MNFWIKMGLLFIVTVVLSVFILLIKKVHWDISIEKKETRDECPVTRSY